MESIQSTMQSNGFPASVTHIQGILCLASLGSCIPLDDVISGPSQVLVPLRERSPSESCAADLG